MSTINLAGNKLPSRDIPMMVQQDVQARPNYIPPRSEDYVGYANDYVDISNKNKEKAKRPEDIFDKLQVPIICAVVFFLFQLPIVRKTIFNHLPSLYFTDGNPQISALFFQTVVFGIFVYVLNTFVIGKNAD
jgi:hypothetical protein